MFVLDLFSLCYRRVFAFLSFIEKACFAHTTISELRKKGFFFKYIQYTNLTEETHTRSIPIGER